MHFHALGYRCGRLWARVFGPWVARSAARRYRRVNEDYVRAFRRDLKNSDLLVARLKAENAVWRHTKEDS